MVILTLTISSCISPKKVEYLQASEKDTKLYKLPEPEVNKIEPNDEIFIKVSSLDEVSFNYFQSESQGYQTSYSNELSLSLITYTVSDSRYIYFPVIGSLYVSNLTLDELRIKLEELLRDYFNQPTVIVKFAFKKITLLGEVNRPGNYTYTKNHINILEALGLAGDLTPYGDIKSLYLIRTENDSVTKSVVDLSDDNLVFSKFYYLNPDDIIYVKPLRSRSWRIISTPISLILYAITTTLLAYNTIKGI